MRCACIDIGSNTTALLVAEVNSGGVQRVATRRAFTLIGSSIGEDGEIERQKRAEVRHAVVEFVALARRLGSDPIVIVATHIVREATNGAELAAEIEQAVNLPVRTLSTRDEACYSFAGALGKVGCPGRLTAAIDAGGGSTEVSWRGPEHPLETVSFAIGSSSLRAEFLETPTPSADDFARARAYADEVFATLSVPRECSVALAVGGGATTARAVVGGLIDEATVRRVLTMAAGTPAAELAERLGIEEHRARLLPAGLIVLAAAAARLGLPLEVGRGGLREGVLLNALANSAN